MTTENGLPESICPRCKAPQDDPDGFGVLGCDKCDFCTHPSASGGVCDVCHRSLVYLDNPDGSVSVEVVAVDEVSTREEP